MTSTEDKLNELFRELVPYEGKADTVAGEIVRAISRIGYRFYNDGDQIGVGYGKETCNPAARYLMENTNEEIKDIICNMWGLFSDDIYEARLHKLEEAVLTFIETNPEKKTKQNTVDMWSYFDECEDKDDDEYGDEEEW